MADNVAVTSGSGNTIAADEVVDGVLGTVKVQFVKIMDGTLDGTGKLIINSGGAMRVGGLITNPSANFTRPADTTAYASGDLVANSTTAGSVVAMSLTPTAVTAGSFLIRRVKLAKSTTTVTNAQFRVHFFRAAPATVTNGDNGVFSVSGVADYVGACDISMDRALTDGACGFGLPIVGSEMSVKLASGTSLFALIEARAAYAPGNAETFTLTLDVMND